jgi:DNA-binding GntR family transcriptional regulator
MLQREAAPLRAQLVAQLRTDIVSGRFGAGHRLIEKNLETEYGVSRTVIREALRQLESERLVDIVPNIGPRVRPLSYDDVVHLYQVRRALESAACELAAQTASIAQVKALRAAFERLERRAYEVELPELVAEKNIFYGAIIEASGNPIIGEMLSNVQARIAQVRSITLASPDRVPHMLAELGKVVEAIEAADPAAANAASQSHVDAAAQIALRHIAHLRSIGELDA